MILSQKELTPAQKAEHLKKVLVDLRYPRMHQMEQKFEKKREALDCLEACRFITPLFLKAGSLR